MKVFNKLITKSVKYLELNIKFLIMIIILITKLTRFLTSIIKILIKDTL